MLGSANELNAVPRPGSKPSMALISGNRRLPEILKQLAAATEAARQTADGVQKPLEQRLAPFAVPGGANAAVRFDPDAGPSCSLEQPPRGRSGVPAENWLHSRSRRR